MSFSLQDKVKNLEVQLQTYKEGGAVADSGVTDLSKLKYNFAPPKSAASEDTPASPAFPAVEEAAKGECVHNLSL